MQVSNPHPNVGSPVTFTVTVTNYGITDSTGFDLKGLLLSNLTFVSATPSVGTYNSATGTATTGYLLQNYVYTLTVNATVKAGTAGTTGTFPQYVQGFDADPNLANNSASASFTVNRPPVAGNDAVQVTPGSSTVIQILNNDSDPDGTLVPNTVTILNPPAQGTVTVNLDGTFTYNAPANFTGTAFTYRVCDNDGACPTATVNVGVALGVILDYFTGSFVMEGVLLEWGTLQETGNLGFDIYRAISTDE